VLRINKDGTIPDDNPFYGTATGNNGAIWALGLRNPFTFAVHPLTGTLFINDVGQSTWEEIDEGMAGGNYGWPATEGPTNDPAYVSPLYWYANSNSASCCASAGPRISKAT
jgi:glucose/arabinose dehydrogenase